MVNLISAPAGVTAVAFAKSHHSMWATGCDDNAIYLWSLGNASCQGCFRGHNSDPTSIVLDSSETNPVLVSGSSGGSVRMWDLVKEQPIRTFSGHRTAVTSMDYHPFGDFLISGSQDTYVRVWDVKNKACLQTYKEHSKVVTVVKFSPDGRWAASGAADGVVKLWDLTAGKCLRELACHTAEITSLYFHPKEFLIAVGSGDHTFSLWDLDRFEMTAKSAPEATGVQKVAFLTERNHIASATSESVKLYDCGTQGTLHARDAVSVDWPQIKDFHFDEKQNTAVSIQFSGNRVWVSETKFGPESRRNSEPLVAPKPGKQIIAPPIENIPPPPQQCLPKEKPSPQSYVTEKPQNYNPQAKPSKVVTPPPQPPQQYLPIEKPSPQSYVSEKPQNYNPQAKPSKVVTTPQRQTMQQRLEPYQRTVPTDGVPQPTDSAVPIPLSGVEPDEMEVVSSMLNQSTSMKRILDARLAQTKILRSMWSKDVRGALQHMHQILESGGDEIGTVIDFLTLMQHQRMKEKVSFDNITMLLGIVSRILSGHNRFERYLIVTFKTARTLHGIFVSRIESVLRAEKHMGIGVDISMEARLEKARSAKKVLENITKQVAEYINRPDQVGEEARLCAAELAKGSA